MPAEHPNSRLETFCDGVFAIAITLLILEIRVPPVGSVHSIGEVWRAIGELWPSFFALSLSFVIILIAWIGHHNLLRAVDKTSSQFQVANGFFLFTIMFMPFPTSFMAEYLNTPYAQPAIVFYCLSNSLHNLGWLALFYTIRRPVPLLRSSIDPVAFNRSARSPIYGFFTYAIVSVVAWWLPYVALVISVSTWIYWLYISFRLREAAVA